MTTPFPPSNLTQAQALIWAGQQLHPDAPLYNMVLAFHINGPVDVGAFLVGFGALVDGTDALRTVFVETDGAPHRVVRDTRPCDLEVIDFTADPDPYAAYEAWAEAEARALFDLSSSLWRSALVKLGDEDFVWWLAQHHLITDGWAAAIVYTRMEQLYRKAVAGDLAAQDLDFPSYDFYADYERRFRDSEAHTDAMAYWDRKSSELPALSFYGADHIGGVSTRTDRVTVDLGADRCARLSALNSDEGGLMGGMAHFNFFATALAACVARISGQDRLAVLAPAHNRPSPRFKNTAGLFIEVLPLYAEIAEGETFRSLLSTVGREAQELLVHARPGTSSATQNNASSVLLNFINASFGAFNEWPMRSTWVHPGHGDSSHDFRLQVHDFDGTGNYRLHFDLSRDVFDKTREKAIVRHFLQVLDAMLDDLDQTIGGVDLLTTEEHEALDRFNDTDVALPYPTVLDAFAVQVAKTPDAVAVTGVDDSITYAELDARSTHLAHRLIASGGAAPRVAIHLRRSVEMVVSVWAVLKAGGSYVPVDSQYPPERCRFLIADSAASVVLATDDLAARLAPAAGTATIVLPLAEEAATPPQVSLEAAQPDDIAYLMYTSGSTGDPKGVLVSHHNLANYVMWARSEYGRGAAVSFPLYSSFGFDLTVTSLFVPLVSGGAVVVYPEPDGSDLSVRDVFAEDRVDVVKLTPAHLSLLDPELLQTSRIRTLILGGEDLKTTVAGAAFAASGGRLEIINEYGPTEATVGCMIHRFDPDTDVFSSVPLGRPAANAQIHILDRDLGSVPNGVLGEMCIGGDGIAQGYYGQDDLTAERFVADPFREGGVLYRTGDLARWRRPGELEFLGRADDQVKVRGYRIELGEIEEALRKHGEVTAAFVDVVETETERAAVPGDIDHCVRCGLAGNHPDALINDEGVCRPCLFYDEYVDKAEAYFGTMDELRSHFPPDRVRNDAGQDCVMLLSGGKDSTYALYQLVEMGLTPLVFSLDNGFISEGAKANIRRAVDDLGLELVMGSTPAMNEIFADSLERFSNVCQGCFKTVYTLGMNLAHERGLHHLVTGLSRGQIFETRLADLFRIGVTDRNDVDEAILEARRAYHRTDDAVRRTLDTDLFDEDDVFDQIHIIDFYRYRDVGLSELYTFLEERAPWVRPADTGRSTNCLINNTGIFVHKKERKFHNYALPYSWDVRLGHKTREAALAELDDEIDVDQVKGILDQVGYEVGAPEDEAAALRGRDKRLVAYYVAASPEMTPAHARSYLGERVPDHMVPSYVVALDALPLTVNGKVDRESLPDPRHHLASDDARYLAPRTPDEKALVDVWEAVLGVDRVGVLDPFIELGGDSILNIQVVSKARSRGLVFTPQQLFQHQTIAALAAVAERQPVAVPAASLPLPQPGGFGAPPISEVDLSAAELDELLQTFGEPE